MATSRTRRILYTGAASVGIFTGAAGIAAAATGPSTPVPPAATSGADNQDATPGYTASITTGDDENEAALQGLATVTADQAIQSATTSTGGTAGAAELENENGNVVYGVEVTLSDASKLDVKVDAGTAAVVSQESGGDEADDAEGPNTEDDATEGDGAEHAGQADGTEQNED